MTDTCADLTIGEFKALVKDSVASSVKTCALPCPIPCAARPHIPAIMNMIKDVDGGDLERGVEQLRHNHEFTTELRRTLKIISMAILVVIGTGAAAGVGGALWYAIKTFVKTGAGA